MTAWVQRSGARPAAAPDVRFGWWLLAPACVAAVLAGLVVGRLASGSHPVLALLLPLGLLPLLLWYRPAVGVLVLIAAAVTVEQFGYTVGPRDGAVTGQIPFFHSVSAGSGVTPAEIYLVVLVVIWVLRTVQRREQLFPRSRLAVQIGVLCGLAVLYLGVGVARHGDFKMGLWEVRPFLYLGLAYLLAASLLSAPGALRAVMWIMVLGSGLKALYGILIWFSIRHLQPRPEAVLAHEESFFFGLFVVLTLGLWVFRVRGPLRLVATGLLPLVLLADMVNSRRTAWAILGTSTLVMLLIAYVRRPNGRRALRRAGVVMLAVSAVYLPAFWSKEGTLAQPARAVRSVVAPDARDEMSNQYRYVEDANLILNIQGKHSTGTGFGLPINYIIGMVDLRSSVKALAYVPHNGVLYVWMRMGLLGEVAIWLMIMHGLMAAAKLSRHPDRETAMFAALVAAAVVAYVIMGDKDMGFTWFRLAFCLGTMLGAVEARTRVWRAVPRPPVAIPAPQSESLLPPARPLVGSAR
ncbi:MAG: O-antigen ligase family protein [Mycobacteriales bacterium]